MTPELKAKLNQGWVVWNQVTGEVVRAWGYPIDELLAELGWRREDCVLNNLGTKPVKRTIVRTGNISPENYIRVDVPPEELEGS